MKDKVDSSNLSDRIKSVVSEAPKKNSNEGASNSFDISNTSNSIGTPTQPRADDEKLAQAKQLRVKYELEKSMVDMKYQQQMTALERKSKPGNPLTQRLMAKVQSEWDNAVQKKIQDFTQQANEQNIQIRFD